jgi:hypothetical protein
VEITVDGNIITYSYSRIVNMDGTSHTVIQSPEKIIAEKDKLQVGAILWWGWGQTVSGVHANCFYIPPVLINRRQREILLFTVSPALFSFLKTKTGSVQKRSVKGNVISTQLWNRCHKKGATNFGRR